MTAFLTILGVLAGLIVLVLVLAFFMRKNHYVKREIIVNVPARTAFEFLRFVGNQDKFNKWARTDPNRKETFKGIDGTIGYVYSWTGDKSAGEGEKEIIDIIDGKKIETEIRFTRPMKAKASVIMETEAMGNDKTRISLSNAGILPYPLNILIPVFERNFGRELGNSLHTLKKLLESNEQYSHVNTIGQ